MTKEEKINKIKEVLRWLPSFHPERIVENGFIEGRMTVVRDAPGVENSWSNEEMFMDGYALYAIQEGEKLLREYLKELEEINE